MSRLSRVEHRFVDSFPAPLEGGVLYVSLRFRTAAHLCACGCGNKVVTPLSPAGWSIRFDGEAITIEPSIGNGRLPCRSHYFIRENRILWSYKMTNELTAKAQKSDDAARLRHYGTKSNPDSIQDPNAAPLSCFPAPQPPKSSLWKRLRGFLQ